MAVPVLLSVDDKEENLRRIRRELQKRYGSDYEVRCEQSAEKALCALEQWQEAGQEIALLLADQWMPEMTGIEFLTQAQEYCPHAKRVLLIGWGDNSAAEAILHAAALGRIDYYIPKPRGPRDEEFHSFITEFLREWSESADVPLEGIQVVGEQWTPRSHEFRDLLSRNGIPYSFYDVASEKGQRLLEQHQATDGPFPVVILYRGTVLKNPTNERMADALAVKVCPEEEAYDVVIVGAGPAGLAAAVYGASEGLKTLVVECEAIGGQAGTSSLIRNYLGFPRGVSGKDLASRAYQQAWLFGVHFYFMRKATKLEVDGDRRVLTLSDGTRIVSRTVVLAMGATYRRLGVPSVEDLLGKGVFYGAAVTEAQAMEGQDVFVVGAGNSAGQAALHLAKYAARVTLLARGATLATSMSDYLIREISDKKNIEVRLNTQVIEGFGTNRLEALLLENRRTGETEKIAATALFLLIGAEPRVEWLPKNTMRDEEGFVKTCLDLVQNEVLPEGWTLDRDPLPLETNLPGVFAAGDVRHSSIKRVASAVGEGAIAINEVHHYLKELHMDATKKEAASLRAIGSSVNKDEPNVLP